MVGSNGSFSLNHKSNSTMPDDKIVYVIFDRELNEYWSSDGWRKTDMAEDLGDTRSWSFEDVFLFESEQEALDAIIEFRLERRKDLEVLVVSIQE